MGDELSAALANLRHAALPTELPQPALVPGFAITCGGAVVTLLPGESVVIGRTPAGTAVGDGFVGVDHPMVSRRHLLVHRDGDELIAEDIGSKNGTILVRGAGSTSLVGPTVLVDGDRLCTVEGVDLGHVVGRPASTSGRRR